jgi:hypothetical protein
MKFVRKIAYVLAVSRAVGAPIGSVRRTTTDSEDPVSARYPEVLFWSITAFGNLAVAHVPEDGLLGLSSYSLSWKHQFESPERPNT